MGPMSLQYLHKHWKKPSSGWFHDKGPIATTDYSTVQHSMRLAQKKRRPARNLHQPVRAPARTPGAGRAAWPIARALAAVSSSRRRIGAVPLILTAEREASSLESHYALLIILQDTYFSSTNSLSSFLGDRLFLSSVPFSSTYSVHPVCFCPCLASQLLRTVQYTGATASGWPLAARFSPSCCSSCSHRCLSQFRGPACQWA